MVAGIKGVVFMHVSASREVVAATVDDPSHIILFDHMSGEEIGRIDLPDVRMVRRRTGPDGRASFVAC